MALFSTKRSVVETLLTSSWSSEEERAQLLEKLRTNPPRSSSELVPFLWHEDGEARRLGTNLFLQRPDPGAVSHFLDELGARPAAVRNALMPLVERLPATEVASHLSRMIASGTPDVKRQGWELALTLPGKVGRGFLERAVLDAPPAVRLKAMQRLVQGTPDASRINLLKRLARDVEREIRLQALEALCTVPGPEVLELMIERLADGEEPEQALAERYLRSADKVDPAAKREVLLSLLSRGNQNSRRIAVRTLLESVSPEEAVREILDRCSGMVGWLRSHVMEALREAGRPVLDAAFEIIAKEEDALRTAAIMMLADGPPDPRTLELFCRLLGDRDWWLRVTACEVLGNLKDERAVPHLVKTLQDEDARWAAVDALAQIGAASTLQPLSQLLRDPREELRLEVLHAFSRFSDQRLLPVIEAVRDRDPSATVRGRAARSCASCGIG